MKNIKAQTWFSAGCLLAMLLLTAAAPPKYVTSGEAGTIASNAAKSLMVWTNSNVADVFASEYPLIYNKPGLAESNVWVNADRFFIGPDMLMYGFGGDVETLVSVRSNNYNNGFNFIVLNDFGEARARLVIDGRPLQNCSLILFKNEDPMVGNSEVSLQWGDTASISGTFQGVPSWSIYAPGYGDFASRVTSPESNIQSNIANFAFITSNLLSGQVYTNFAQRGHVSATIVLTNILAGDYSSMTLIVDDDGGGSWDRTNGPVSLQGVALSAGQQQLRGLLQPGARFAFTNQSAGTSPSATIRSGSCEWSRW